MDKTAVARFDSRLTKVIRGLPSSYRPLVVAISFLGEPVIVAGLGLVGFLSVLRHDQSAERRAFGYALVAFGLNSLLKILLRRRRPHGHSMKVFGMPSYSFPSGHAFGTVIFYGLFAYLGLRYDLSYWSIALAVIFAISAFAIGVSRVYLGVHYPSDVLAGWLLGGLSLYLVIILAY